MNTDNKKKARLYTHAFEVAFEVTTRCKNLKRIPISELRKAMQKRAGRIDKDAVTCYDRDLTGKEDK